MNPRARLQPTATVHISGSEPTPDDEVSDRNLHRLTALIQRRGLYLDDTLIGA
jgi:hypothetical protein